MKKYCIYAQLIISLSVIDTNFVTGQWEKINSLDGSHISCFATIGSNLFAGIGASLFTATNDYGVLLSTDNGTNWASVNSGMGICLVRSLINSGSDLFAGTIQQGVFLSTNNGTSWTNISRGLFYDRGEVNKLLIDDGYLYAGTANGIFLTTDVGLSWTSVSSGLTYKNVLSFTILKNNLFVGSGNILPSPLASGVFRSTNRGDSWTQISDIYANSLIAKDSILFAGGGRLYISTDNGSNWILKDNGLPSPFFIYSFASIDYYIFAGIDSSVFLSTNDGSTWTAVSSGLPNRQITALAIHDRILFAGTWGAGIWKIPLSEVITSVKTLTTNKEIQFNLHQNYPNPFNSSTTILFNIPIKSFTSLKIFDLNGREVATLISEELSAGKYSKKFYSDKLTSGIYFYRLRFGSIIETKKFVLLK